METNSCSSGYLHHTETSPEWEKKKSARTMDVECIEWICWFTYGNWHKFSVFVLRFGGVDSNKTSKTAWICRRTSSFNKRAGFFLHSDQVRSLPSWSEVVILYIENYLFFATVLATFLPLNVVIFRSLWWSRLLFEREIAFLQKSDSFF